MNLDRLAVEPNLEPLTEHELEELVRRVTSGNYAPVLRQAVIRLCREVKVLRDQAAVREQSAAEEIAW